MNRPRGLSLAAALLAGCASQAPAPGPGHPADPDPIPLRETAGVDWSDGLSLEELLAAVERHGRVIAALEDWEAARARRVEAGIYPHYPELSARGSQTFVGHRTMAGLSLHQRIELGGRVSKREAVADAGIARSGAEARETLRLLRARGRHAYWASVIASRRLEVARRVAAVTAKDLEAALARYEARLATAIDMNLARVAAARAQAAVRTAEGSVAAARAEVEALVWEPAPAGWILADGVPAHRPEPDFARAIELARAARPDLAVLSAAEAEQDARAVLARAEAAPDLGVGIGYEFGRDRIMGDGVDIRMKGHSAMVGLSLSLPLWNRKRGDILEAEARRRHFAALRSALATEVDREVATADARLRSSTAALELFEKEILPAAAKNLDDTRAAYASGEVGIAELLRAQQDFLDAQGGWVDAEAAYTEARADLESAVDRPLGELAR